MYCGFYLNELIIRLLKRGDAYPDLFALYGNTLRQLSKGGDIEMALRYFELTLLQVLGYAPLLDCEANGGLSIEAETLYYYQVELGASRIASRALPAVHGATLLALAQGKLLEPMQKNEARILMRYILQFYLGEKPLKSRELFS